MPARKLPADESAKGALLVMGQRLAGHSALYAIGSGMTFAFMLLQFAVLTRLLAKDAFGALAILFLTGAAITILCNMLLVTGSIMAIFQGGDEDELSEQPERFGTDSRGVLASGLIAVALVGAGIIGIVAAIGPQASRELLDGEAGAAAIVWATVDGVLGSMWRLVTAIPRFERRPVVYLGLSFLGHSAALAGAIALVEAGYGITGAVAGLALGRGLVFFLALAVARHRLRLGFRLAYVAKVFRIGRPYILIMGSFFIGRNADLLVLSRFVENAELAAYLVASRLGMVPNFAVSAAMIAWGPLLRGPLRAALEKQKTIDIARSRVLGYYLLLAVWTVVAAWLFADVVIKIAPSEYAGAAELVPLLTVAAALQGLVMVTFRMSRFDRKLRRFKQVAVFTAVATTAAAFVFVPIGGAVAAALVALTVPGIGAAVLLLSQRRGNPLIIDRRQVAGCLLVGAWLIVGGELARPLPFWPEIAVDALAVALYPVLLMITGALPAAQVKRLVGFGGAVRSSRAGRREAQLGLRELPRDDVELLQALIRDRELPSAVGERLGEHEDDVIRRMVLLLRRLAGLQGRSVIEAKLGRYLLSRASRTQRDRAGYILSLSKEVRAMDLERMTQLFDRLAALPASEWRAAVDAAGDPRAGDRPAAPPAGQAAPSSR